MYDIEVILGGLAKICAVVGCLMLIERVSSFWQDAVHQKRYLQFRDALRAERAVLSGTGDDADLQDPVMLRRRAEQIVEGVRGQVSVRRQDLGFILQAPSFFDFTSGPAAGLWEALARWEDHDRVVLDAGEALHRAEQLQELFEKAVAWAQAEGLKELSSRRRRKILTAQALALRAANASGGLDPETCREITRILVGLRLHYLGRSNIEAITALAPAARTETTV